MKRRIWWLVPALCLAFAPASQAALSASARQAQLKDMNTVLAESMKSDDALKACYDAASRGEEKSFYALAIITDAYRLLEQRSRMSERMIASRLDTPSERRQAEKYALSTLPRVQETMRGYRSAMDYCGGKIKPRPAIK